MNFSFRPRIVGWSVVVTSVLIASDAARAELAVGQTDTFSSGAPEGWIHAGPSPIPPTAEADSGPAGIGDFALQIRALGGSGPGSRLIAFNTTQWTGDYLSAGINAISMDLRNTGNAPLEMRLAIDGAGGRFSTGTSIALSADGDWESVVFPINPSGLVSVDGGFNAAATLADLSVIRFIHSFSPSWHAVPVAGKLLVDNIHALAVPEPASATLFLLIGSVGWAFFRRRSTITTR